MVFPALCCRAERDYATPSCLSVCPSVCQSVTLSYDYLLFTKRPPILDNNYYQSKMLTALYHRT